LNRTALIGELKMVAEETTIWKGSPSQVVNFRVFVLCLLLCWLIAPIFFALYKWLKVRCRKFEITTERIRMFDGILSKRTEELELYRIKDATVIEPFWLRMFSLGNIQLTTSDRSHPTLIIPAVPKVQELREQLRNNIERLRQKKGVKEVDFE
jgi:uncharacterized membrane protein YdbT with pleckstrin-like domain